MSVNIDDIRKLVVSGNLVRARVLGENLCAKTNSPDLLLLMGIIAGRMGDLDAAVRFVSRSLDLHEASAEAHFYLATVLRAKKEIDAAIRHTRRGLQLNPRSAEGYNKLGALLRMQDDNDRAEQAFSAAIELDPANALATYNLGYLLQQRLDLSGAETLFTRTLQLKPDLADAHSQLGAVLYQQGRLQEAVKALDTAIGLNNRLAEAHTIKGLALDMLGYPSNAEHCLREAVNVQPDNLKARLMLANTWLNRSRLVESVDEYRRILEYEPGHILALVALAHACLYQGDDDASLRYAGKAMELDPEGIEARAGAASIYDRLGRFDEAYQCLLPLIEKGITTVSVAQLFASICRHVSQCDRAIEEIENLLANQKLIPDEKRQLYFAVARLYDRQRDYERAFHCYDEANRLKFWPFSPEKHRKKIDSLIEVYNRNFLEEAPRFRESSEKMIFIVGMPRSGTSLVEQILDSHSQVYGAGELTFISQIMMGLQDSLGEKREYPYYMEYITAEVLEGMAKDYMGRLPEESRPFLRVTDKLPENFLHLGLIQLMFPNARIIHCRRGPLDTCLSCYCQDFSGYLNYAFNLEHLGFYYREYLRLMDHWKDVLSLPMLEVQYENMVEDTEQNIRTILEFCGLPWEEDCLSFHESARVVKTASYDQVRRPIYKGSIGRWKHYSHHLGPLKQALGME